MSDWKAKIEAEFDRAQDARASGNEGQARVCARRAAGTAIREYYARRGQSVRTPSAYDLLQLLADEPHLSPELKQPILDNLLYLFNRYEILIFVTKVLSGTSGR